MLTTDITGTIFNIQKFSVHDGPGIRTTVFMKGCPLHCRWCSNAESMSPYPEPGIIRSNCDLCGECTAVCPLGALTIAGNELRIDRSLCDGCGKCVDACYRDAITIYGRQVTVDEVLDVVRKDKDYYLGSNGGVTVSGGEPLRQSIFVFELFKKCREEGILTCLDTCGYASGEAIKAVLPYVDYILYDLKLINPEKHEQFTGVDNRVIKDNAATAVSSGASILFRIPLIKDVNCTLENITETAEFISSLGEGLSIEMLPYHRLGIGKYRTLDRDYPGIDMETPSAEEMQQMKEIFEHYGVQCTIGG
ncbi:MAG: glycyl-radical enzyme activating protein [Dehalococcoidales bacterium]|nr:glycyl-radical enzyme activating protein [Dehalococcoidales bacterium]